MKVILTEEVIGLGEPGKVVDVAPGYARNFLVPRKMAVYSGTASAKQMEHLKRELDRKRQRLQNAAKSTADRINGQTLVMVVKAGEAGKLYGSVTTADIAAAVKEKFELDIDRRKLHLKEPIRTLGTHEVDVHFIGDTHATLMVSVQTGQTAAPAPAAAPAPTPAPEAPAAEEGGAVEESAD